MGNNPMRPRGAPPELPFLRHRLIHRPIVRIMNGFVEGLEAERKRVPGQILYDSNRLECLFFCGYDPHFEGDEPPGF
jgi:hypothetical protein